MFFDQVISKVTEQGTLFIDLPRIFEVNFRLFVTSLGIDRIIDDLISDHSTFGNHDSLIIEIKPHYIIVKEVHQSVFVGICPLSNPYITYLWSSNWRKQF